MTRLGWMFSVACLLLVGSAAAADNGSVAPDFALKDTTGKDVKLADLKGKIVVLEWFNIDCPFCKRHADSKTFSALSDKYKEKGVVVLGVDSTSSHDAAAIKAAKDSNKLTYEVLADPTGVVGKAYGAKSTPHIFVIGKDGKLAYQGAPDNDPQGNGSGVVNYTEKAVEELLAGKAVTTATTQQYGCGVKYAK